MSRPRIRTIKPEMWQDEKIGALSRDARLLFIGLVTMADDEGRLRALSSVILGHVFPYDEDAPKKLKAWTRELIDCGLIIAYTVGSTPYIQLVGWRKHQVINRPTDSELPPPPLTEDSVNDHGGATEHSSLVRGRAPADRIGSERTPLPPEGEKRVTYGRKPVPTARLELAERVLAEFNRQAATSYAALTGRGQPSEDLKRIIGALTDAVPALEFDEAKLMIESALRRPYWEGRPHTGVVFGPKVIGRYREQARAAQLTAVATGGGLARFITGEQDDAEEQSAA